MIIRPCIYETEALCWIKRRVIKLRLMAGKTLSCRLPHILYSPFPQKWIFKRNNSHNTLSRQKSQILGGQMLDVQFFIESRPDHTSFAVFYPLHEKKAQGPYFQQF